MPSIFGYDAPQGRPLGKQTILAPTFYINFDKDFAGSNVWSTPHISLTTNLFVQAGTVWPIDLTSLYFPLTCRCLEDHGWIAKFAFPYSTDPLLWQHLLFIVKTKSLTCGGIHKHGLLQALYLEGSMAMQETNNKGTLSLGKWCPRFKACDSLSGVAFSTNLMISSAASCQHGVQSH